MITLKSSRKITVQKPLAEIIQLYPFWDELPEEAMRQVPRTTTGSILSPFGTVIGDGCYLSPGHHDAD